MNAHGKRILLVATLALVTAGCRNDNQFDAQTQYTPETVAQELSFRYRELSGDARKLKPRVAAKSKAPKASEHEQAKAGESKKEALVKTADSVFDNVANKIRQVPGAKKDFCKKVAEALRKDGSLSSSEQDDLAHRLEALGAEL